MKIAIILKDQFPKKINKIILYFIKIVFTNPIKNMINKFLTMLKNRANINNFRIIRFVLVFSFIIKSFAIGKIKQDLMEENEGDFKLYSTAFKNEDTIPEKYSADGENVNPPLQWENPPKDTKSFALIVDDPDAPGGVFTHWLLKDIPRNTHKINENTIVGKEVINSWGQHNWKGPKPPSGTHRYYFKLYALSEDKMHANTLKDFYIEADKYKIAEAVLMGKYTKKNK